MDRFAECLYARPSFLEGAARIMDFSDSMTFFNTRETPEEADRVALATDWAVVANLIRWACAEEACERDKQLRFNL